MPVITPVKSIAKQTPAVNKPFILKVSIVAALGGLLFGYDTAIISGAIPFIKSYFSLGAYGLGWAVSAILIGCGAGALLAGPLSETFGRRFVLIICAVLFAVSGVGTSLSSSLFIFILFRLAGGLGVGAAAMVSPMYIAEMAPANWRGRLVSLYQLAIVSGILLAYFASYLLADTGSNNWRWMFASQVAPSALFFVMLLFVPETPRWLVKQGREAAAHEVLKKTVGEGYSKQTLAEISNSFRKERKSAWADLFSATLFSAKYRTVIWIGIAIAVFQQVTGINAVIYYAPVILKATGLSTAGSLFQTMGIGMINIMATLLAIGLVDKVGRKRLLLNGSLCMGISLVVLGACFHYHYFENYIVLVFLLVYVGSFGATWGAVAWVYLSEIFPNSIRGSALSVATLALWLADFIVSYTFPVMTNRWGSSATFFTYACLCLAAFIYVFIKVPETRGASLEEIEKLLITTSN